MARPERLEKNLKARKAICDLLQSPAISAQTRIYLAQLREVLDAEIAALENDTQQSASA